MRGRVFLLLLLGDVEVEEEFVFFVIIEYLILSIEEVDVVGVDFGVVDF